MARRAQSSIPTIAEKVSQSPVLNPAIRSYSYSEYDERRPGYVNPDRSAGAAYGALARSLSGFYSAFNRLATQEQDKWVEESVAQGKQILADQHDTEGELRNKMSWKELVEKHPEYANLNPWVEKGYEAARLKELGIEMTSGLNQFLDKNGIYNNEDPQVLQSGVNTYIANFRTQQGLNNYEDKILMSKFFSPLEAQARANVTSRYDNIQINGRQEKLAEGTSSLIATSIMTSLENNQPIDYESIGKILTDSLGNGLLDANATKVMLNGLKTAYLRTKDRDALETVKNIEINGKKLIDLPEGAEWYVKTIDKLNDEAVARAKAAATASEKFKKGAMLNAALALSDGMTNGQFTSFDEAVAYYEKQTGTELSLEDSWSLREEIRKINDEKQRQANQEGNLPANITTVQLSSSNAYARSGNIDDARENLAALVRSNPLNKTYRDEYEKLMGPEGQKHYDAKKGQEAYIKKNLDEMVPKFVDSFIKADGDTQINPANRSRLISEVTQRMKRDIAAELARQKSLIPEKDKDGKPVLFTVQDEQNILEPILQNVRDRLDGGVYTAGLDRRDFLQGSPNLVPGSVLFSNDPAKPDTPDVIAAKQNYAVETEKYLDSNENKTLGNMPLKRLDDFIDTKALFASGNTKPDAASIIPFLRPEKGFIRPSLSEDGKTLIIEPFEAPSQEDADRLENNAKVLFPQIKGVVFMVKPQPKKPPYRSGSWGFLDTQ
nr:MAG TPA: hypothetical protein [Caudoviricetes sp.]